MKLAFIAAETATYPVTVLCRTLEVSRAGFYTAQDRAPSARARADTKLGVEIAAIHAESRQRYGSPRVQAELQARGPHHPSRKRVARLMRQQGLVARRRRRFRVTTDSNPSRPVAPNVVAWQFTTTAPNTTWVTDITYICTGEAGCTWRSYSSCSHGSSWVGP